MRRLGTLPTDWPDFARSLVPLALLALAAAVVPLRIAVLVALAAGAAIGIARDAPVRWAWAAAVPVAVSLAWGVLPAPVASVDGSPGAWSRDDLRHARRWRTCKTPVSESQASGQRTSAELS